MNKEEIKQALKLAAKKDPVSHGKKIRVLLWKILTLFPEYFLKVIMSFFETTLNVFTAFILLFTAIKIEIVQQYEILRNKLYREAVRELKLERKK